MVILTTASDTNSTMSARLGVGVGAGVGVNVGVTTGSNFGDGAGSGVGDGVGGGAGVAMATRVEVTSGVGDAVGRAVADGCGADSTAVAGANVGIDGVPEEQDITANPKITVVVAQQTARRGCNRFIQPQSASDAMILTCPQLFPTNTAPLPFGCSRGRTGAWWRQWVRRSWSRAPWLGKNGGVQAMVKSKAIRLTENLGLIGFGSMRLPLPSE